MLLSHGAHSPDLIVALLAHGRSTGDGTPAFTRSLWCWTRVWRCRAVSCPGAHGTGAFDAGGAGAQGGAAGRGSSSGQRAAAGHTPARGCWKIPGCRLQQRDQHRPGMRCCRGCSWVAARQPCVGCGVCLLGCCPGTPEPQRAQGRPGWVPSPIHQREQLVSRPRTRSAQHGRGRRIPAAQPVPALRRGSRPQQLRQPPGAVRGTHGPAAAAGQGAAAAGEGHGGCPASRHRPLLLHGCNPPASEPRPGCASPQPRPSAGVVSARRSCPRTS